MFKNFKFKNVKVIDHSKTYKNISIKNIPHIARLSFQKKLLKKIASPDKNYADFGCSNGYITDIVSKIIKASNTYGFDHSKNINIAQTKYPNYKFKFLDLNQPHNFEFNFDIITCFEVLEHVGNIENALNNLINSIKNKGTILLSVPIEIGLIGLIKYLIKRLLFRYKFNLKGSEIKYIYALLTRKDISKFREEKSHYGSHFGFDYRVVETLLKSKNIEFSQFTNFTTRYFIIKKNNSTN